VVGGGVTVVGVAVGVFMQVQVGVGEVDDGGDGGPEGPPGGTVVAVASGPPLGAVDASAEFETNITVKLVAASAMLASPAIFARFVSFNAVTRLLLAAGKRARTGGLRPGLRLSSRCNALVSRFVGRQGAMLSKDRHVTGWSAL